MNGLIKINDTEITIKEYMGQRVVTFKEIDTVHGRASGTARKRFSDNRERFIAGVDYYKICSSEIRTNKIPGIPPATHRDIYLITETGYLMLVKSFTDDLAWKVQRELVNHYFSGSPAKLRIARPKKTAEEMLQKLRERNTTTNVLVELFDTLDSDEYRGPIGEVLKIVSFDISCIACDLNRLTNRQSAY